MILPLILTLWCVGLADDLYYRFKNVPCSVFPELKQSVLVLLKRKSYIALSLFVLAVLIFVIPIAPILKALLRILVIVLSLLDYVALFLKRL